MIDTLIQIIDSMIVPVIHILIIVSMIGILLWAFSDYSNKST